ncbi:MAG: AraC family transcriptional regulator [Pedobacter sp.]|nr:MAG: AraC family transcriptional regulator [Pedobacter sp.]
MIFVLKGKLSLKKKGNQEAFAEIENQKHNLCRIPMSQTLLFLEKPDDQIFCINLSHEYISRFLPSNHKIYKMLMLGKNDESVLLSAVNLPISPEISSILQRLGQLQTAELGDQLILESKIIELLALQITQYEHLKSSSVTVALKAEELKKMEQAREILIHHEGERISLRSLAHLVGTNECYLKRNFKAAFGNSVYSYLNQYKMEQAKDMLIEKGMTITQVAAKTGYKHATHFTNAFKKYFGYLPNKLKSSKLSLLVFADDLFMVFENLCFI